MFRLAEKVKSVFDYYKIKSNSIPIIVEGKHDIQSLVLLGFNGNFEILNRGKSLLSTAEMLAKNHHELIPLTDFDRKGILLKISIAQYLRAYGVNVDLYLWDFIHRFLPVKTVEDLPWAYELVTSGRY